jgi:hypothetical protein
MGELYILRTKKLPEEISDAGTTTSEIGEGILPSVEE